MKKDYIPSKDGDFNIFQNNLVTQVVANAVAWAIAAGDITLVQSQQALWLAAWAVAQNKANRTPVQTEAKDEQRAIYESTLRDFIQRWIVRNDAMTDSERESCGIMPHETHHTPVPVPASLPLIEMLPETGHRVKIYFRQQADAQGVSRRGKPDGVQFCEFAYHMDEQPQSADDCSHKALVTRSPKFADFSEQQAGRKVYFYARWVNPRGEAGPWTNMLQFMVP